MTEENIDDAYVKLAQDPCWSDEHARCREHHDLDGEEEIGDVSLNPASEYVEASRGTSSMHRYVADEGTGMTKQDIEHVVVSGRCVAIGDDVTAEDRTIIEEAIRATKPSEKACFANALNMWGYDNRFAYVEGFAVMADLDYDGIEHAWCLLDGETLVDPTAAFDHYHGAVIPDPDILNRYASSDLRASGIIGNHENRHEFLRARGYGDDR